MRFPTTIWLYTTMFAIKFTLFTWSMSQDLSFLWWKNNMIHCWLRRSFNLSNCQDIPSIYWYMYWFFSLNLQIHYLMYTVLYAWLFFFIELTTTCRQYFSPELTFSGEETRVSVSGHTSRQVSTDMSQEYAELMAQDNVFQETLAPDEGSVTYTLL